MRKRIAFSAIIFSVSFCTKKSASKVNEFAANGTASIPINVAVVVLGDDNGIPGTKLDFNRMQDFFKQLNFRVVPLNKPSKSQLMQTIQVETQRMLENDRVLRSKNIPSGTFAFYHSGHGAQGGMTMLSDGSFYSAPEILNAIAAGRQNFPLERFIMMFDTCFSGANITTLASPGASALNSLYKQFIFFAASRPNESSVDTDQGAVATSAFISAVQTALTSNSTITFGDVLRRTAQQTTSFGRNQHIMVCAGPSSGPGNLLALPVKTKLENGALPGFITDATAQDRACATDLGAANLNSGTANNNINWNSTPNTGYQNENTSNNNSSNNNYNGGLAANSGQQQTPQGGCQNGMCPAQQSGGAESSDEEWWNF